MFVPLYLIHRWSMTRPNRSSPVYWSPASPTDSAPCLMHLVGDRAGRVGAAGGRELEYPPGRVVGVVHAPHRAVHAAAQRGDVVCRHSAEHVVGIFVD